MATRICDAFCFPMTGKAIRCGAITRQKDLGIFQQHFYLASKSNKLKFSERSPTKKYMTTVETATGESKTMVLNMGPQHPSTHGVLRVALELDGETVVKAVPDLGYLHTGIEKSCEHKTYSQAITLTDRMDYLNPLGNNLVYCLAVEKLLGIEIPKRAQYIRVMMVELQRISSHLVWL